MKLEAIKEAISGLPAAERVSLVHWLNVQDVNEWDRQMKADFSEGGPGMTLLQQWDAEIQSGQSIPLEEFLQRETKFPYQR